MPKNKILQTTKTLQEFREILLLGHKEGEFDGAFVKMAMNLNNELDNFEAMMAVKGNDDIIVENLHKELREIKPKVELITNKVITDFLCV